MALLVPISQEVCPIRNGNLVVTTVELVSASDTVDVPTMISDTTVASCVQIRRVGDAAATVTQSDHNTVAIVGTAGNQCTIVSLSDKPIRESDQN
jgi:hypothetical protein